jgi:hypothetical protein
VDFDLMRVHPKTIGLMMGYNPERWLKGRDLKVIMRDAREGGRVAPRQFYQHMSAAIAFGNMLMNGYGYHPHLARLIQMYALMQAPQKVYLPDTVTDIHYHDGTQWLSTSDAFRASRRMKSSSWDLYNQIPRVRITYASGLQVWVNYKSGGNWTVQHDGASYTLPDYGWLIAGESEVPQSSSALVARSRPPEDDRNTITGDDSGPRGQAVAPDTSPLLAYSALVNGHRVDYVRCADYIYVNSNGREQPFEYGVINGAVWLKKQPGGAYQVIPCGDLGKWVTRGHWKSTDPSGVLTSDRCLNPPADRGVRKLELDTQALLGVAPDTVAVTARGFDAEAGTPIELPANGNNLVFSPNAETIDYIVSER